VDGGISRDTVADVVRAGAEILVAATPCSAAADPRKNGQALLKAATEAALAKV